MSGFLSSIQDTPEAPPADPLVLDLDSDDAGNVLAALSSETARSIIQELHREPATLSTVADRVGTSRQNAQYHLTQLQEVKAVKVVDTLYSEKGREMKVYAPAGAPLVIVSGESDERSSLRESITNVLAPVAMVGVVGAAIQVLAGDSPTDPAGDEPLIGEEPDVDDPNVEDQMDELEVRSGYADGEEVTLADPIVVDLAETAPALWEAYPGLVFLAGAFTAMAVMSAWQWWR